MLNNLSDAQEQIDTFFDLSPDLLAIADPHGYFIRINPAWTRVLGYNQEEILNRPFITFIVDEDIHKTLVELTNISSNRKEIESFQNRYIAKDGTIVTLDWRSISENGLIYAIARPVESP